MIFALTFWKPTVRRCFTTRCTQLIVFNKFCITWNGNCECKITRFLVFLILSEGLINSPIQKLTHEVFAVAAVVVADHDSQTHRTIEACLRKRSCGRFFDQLRKKIDMYIFRKRSEIENKLIHSYILEK